MLQFTILHCIQIQERKMITKSQENLRALLLAWHINVCDVIGFDAQNLLSNSGQYVALVNKANLDPNSYLITVKTNKSTEVTLNYYTVCVYKHRNKVNVSWSLSKCIFPYPHTGILTLPVFPHNIHIQETKGEL